ncbi:hypothetical protein H0H92_010869 [Tricholoma furcatifolium]|nr:hypothetical protein H0H92_010869 [Tricholoma furcatifolium]
MSETCSLPDTILESILERLDMSSVVLMSTTCKHVNQLVAGLVGEEQQWVSAFHHLMQIGAVVAEPSRDDRYDYALESSSSKRSRARLSLRIRLVPDHCGVALESVRVILLQLELDVVELTYEGTYVTPDPWLGLYWDLLLEVVDLGIRRSSAVSVCIRSPCAIDRQRRTDHRKPRICSDNIEQFHIHSDRPIPNAFSQRLICLISKAAPTLSSLSLHNLDLPHDAWACLLSTLIFHSLAHVAFGNSSIPFTDLDAFLSRHPSLETLDLTYGVPIGILPKTSSHNHFPRIRKLVANPEYLEHFLESPTGLPHLLDVIMTTDYAPAVRGVTSQNWEYDFSRFDGVIRKLEGLRRQTKFGLRILEQAGFSAWIKGLQTKRERGVMARVECVVELVVEVDSSPIWWESLEFGPLLDLFPSLTRMVLKWFGVQTTIV